MQTGGLEPTISENDRSQTLILESEATGIGLLHSFPFQKVCPPQPRGVF